MYSNNRFKHFLPLISLVILAFIVLLTVYLIWQMEPMLSRDGTFYAKQITEKVKNNLSFYHADFSKPPLFQLCCCSICRCLGWSAEQTILRFNAFCLALMVFPMAYVARRIFVSAKIAFFCAALLVFSPALFQTVTGGTREPLFLLLLLLSIASLLRYRKNHSLHWLLISAVFSCFAGLTRFEGGAWSIFCVLYIFSGMKDPRFRKFYFLSGACFAAAVVVIWGGAFAVSTEIRVFTVRLLSQGWRILL